MMNLLDKTCIFKIAVLITAFCFVSKVGSCQHENFIEVSVGLNQRTNSSQFTPTLTPSGRVWNSYIRYNSKFSSGLLVNASFQKIIKKKLVLEFSLQYTESKRKIETTYFDSEGNPKEGIPVDFVFYQNYNYNRVDIPIKFGYSFFERFSVMPKIGVLFTNQKGYTITSTNWSTTHDLFPQGQNLGPQDFSETEFEFYTDGTLESSQNRENRSEQSLLGELELNYELNKKLCVVFSSSVSYNFKNFKRKEIDPLFYRLFIRIGLKYRLGKRVSAQSEE